MRARLTRVVLVFALASLLTSPAFADWRTSVASFSPSFPSLLRGSNETLLVAVAVPSTAKGQVHHEEHEESWGKFPSLIHTLGGGSDRSLSPIFVAFVPFVVSDSGNSVSTPPRPNKDHEDVNAAQADGTTALHRAVTHDDVDAARRLLAAGADVGATNLYGVAPLSLACQIGNSEIVELLLERGADPNTSLRGGETALLTAARTGRPGPVEALLRRGADVNARERRGQTALMWAAADGHVEVVERLIRAGADLNAVLPDSGFTPLLFAAREGRTAVVHALLKAGVDLNAATTPRKPGGKMPAKGTSALILAIENGHFELALSLIDAGANPNDQRSGFTPLHIVTWVRKPPRGEDFGMPPPPELTGLSSLQFVRELVRRGADVNARLAEGRGGWGKFHTQGATAFLMASATADVPYMKLLLELGADPSLSNVDGCTPLIAACGIHVGSDQATEVAGEEPEVLEAAALLLKAGADVNAVDANGETAMHGAALKNLPKVVQYLADHGAKSEVWNRPNRFGSTPLMIARGYRPGNFKPSQETAAAIERVMLAAGIPVPDNTPPTVLRNSDWEPLPVVHKPKAAKVAEDASQPD